MTTATDTIPAKSSAPPPAAAPVAPRVLRPLPPSRLKLDEHVVHHWTVTLQPTDEFEDLLNPSYWQNCPTGDYGLRQGDLIGVHGARGEIFAELYVRRVTTANPRSGSKAGAIVEVLRCHEFPELTAVERPIDFLAYFGGPGVSWTVVRRSDGKTMIDQLPDRDTALKHASALQAATR
jgi:hypothetical protein